MRKTMFLLIFLPVLLQAQSDLLDSPPTFIPHAKAEKMPGPFVRMDSLLAALYRQAGHTESVGKIVHDMNDEKLLEYAKVLALVNLFPEKLYGDLISKENKPWDERLKLRMHGTQHNLKAKYFYQPKPGGVVRYLIKTIIKRLPWQWKFHLTTKYILEVQVNKAVKTKIGQSKVPYYYVHILRDIKGNYHGKKNIELIGNYIIGEMKKNNKYLVLILEENNMEPGYLVRGIATENYGFFPVENGRIQDNDNRLHTEKINIKIEDYKKNIESFFNKIMGGYDEKK